jgi:ornithine cyclodeaminase
VTPRVITLDQLRNLKLDPAILAGIERGFMLLSEGKVVVPPVGEMLFADPPGDVHIKYGYIIGDDQYLVKIASGFYRNVEAGLNPNPGLMLLASQRTGAIDLILIEDGFLTNLRTAAAGAVAAKWLARPDATRIAVFGTGVQAAMQVEALKLVTTARQVFVWGRRFEAAQALADRLSRQGFLAVAAREPAEAAEDADIPVTATASETPFLSAAMVKPGAHVTAMGSDTETKTECDPALIARADIVAVDSLAQARLRGEVRHAVSAGLRTWSDIVELGTLIARGHRGRRDIHDITFADLSGVAVQDIMICKAALEQLA